MFERPNVQASDSMLMPPVAGEAFRPLADDSELQSLVFTNGHGPFGGPPRNSSVRPQQVDQRYAEKSVQLMHERSGGAVKGQDVANRFGKVGRCL